MSQFGTSLRKQIGDGKLRPNDFGPQALQQKQFQTLRQRAQPRPPDIAPEGARSTGSLPLPRQQAPTPSLSQPTGLLSDYQRAASETAGGPPLALQSFVPTLSGKNGAAAKGKIGTPSTGRAGAGDVREQKTDRAGTSRTAPGGSLSVKPGFIGGIEYINQFRKTHGRDPGPGDRQPTQEELEILGQETIDEAIFAGLADPETGNNFQNMTPEERALVLDERFPGFSNLPEDVRNQQFEHLENKDIPDYIRSADIQDTISANETNESNVAISLEGFDNAAAKLGGLLNDIDRIYENEEYAAHKADLFERSREGAEFAVSDEMVQQRITEGDELIARFIAGSAASSAASFGARGVGQGSSAAQAAAGAAWKGLQSSLSLRNTLGLHQDTANRQAAGEALRQYGGVIGHENAVIESATSFVRGALADLEIAKANAEQGVAFDFSVLAASTFFFENLAQEQAQLEQEQNPSLFDWGKDLLETFVLDYLPGIAFNQAGLI